MEYHLGDWTSFLSKAETLLVRLKDMDEYLGVIEEMLLLLMTESGIRY